jgi:HPt (histidine-containing phosphotransfer) domain-containing protein
VPEPEEETYENQICDLVLEDIKPIHFDFQLEEASKDLSLPVDLIEEFVNDFIAQAHEEKKNFIDLCKKGDIDEIHRLGHKLKGVASNLRINPLADTLEEIQFSEDRSRFEPLLKKYWGQFLAFEIYMKNISHQAGGK